MPEAHTIGRAERRRDAVKLATGRATFADDVALPGLLHACVLTSPHPHARIQHIDAGAARALPGVVAVLTAEDFPGAPDREPLFGSHVRFAGDRVAVVAAEEAELARRACDVVDVRYETLPAVLHVDAAVAAGSPVVAELGADLGDVEAAIAGAEHVLTRTYQVPRVAQASLEPQVCLAWLDEDHRLVVRTSSHVPFEVRRVVARRLGLPLQRVRVVTPRDGGAFGGRFGIVTEDLCAALALRTGRPVRLLRPREHELAGPRAGHSQVVTLRSGVRDGRLVALDMTVVEGACDGGGWTEASLRAAGGTLALYRCPNVRFRGRALETHEPPAGVMRGDGVTQAVFALESHIDELAAAAGDDPVAFRARNHLREGDETPIWTALAGSEARPRVVQSCGLDEALRLGAGAIGWSTRRTIADGAPRRGYGVALALQSPGPVGAETASATIDMNEDGSFVLFVGTSDMDAGGDTVLCQIAAEVLGVPVESVSAHPADTDVVPFSSGPVRSSALYVSGIAVRNTAAAVLERIAEHGAQMLQLRRDDVTVQDGAVHAPDGRRLTYDAIGRATMLGAEPVPITATTSHSTDDAPSPFAAVFVEVDVDEATGVVQVRKIVEAVDCGRVLHPQIAEARLEGGAVQGLGYTLGEAIRLDAEGRSTSRTLRDYPVPTAADVPEIQTLLVSSHEPTGPFGAKPIAEIAIHGVAPAVANAVAHALGVRLFELPLTPERVRAACDTKDE